MLIDFTVRNFSSFKDETTFSLLATNDKTNEEEQLVQINNKIRLLKNAAIYGANASGKSNLLKAIRFMKSFIINSSKESQQGDKINVEPFKFSTETENSPSLFEVTFIFENIIYRYGFETTEDTIVSEWLFGRFSARESKLFIREGQKISLGDRFKEGKIYQSSVRENALFISVCSQFNGEISTKVIEWFRNVNIISSLDSDYVNVTLEILKNKNNLLSEQKEMLIHLIKGIDVGIEDIALEKKKADIETMLDNMPIKIAKKILSELNSIKEENEAVVEVMAQHVSTLHCKYNEENEFVGMETCNFEIESTGTQKIFELAGPIIDTLFNNKILFIDEIQNSLHTILLTGLINFFTQTKKATNAQYIFTTHDIKILSNQGFRRDQFWFVEKNKYGQSELTCLTDFNEHVRKDASIEKDYLRGRYGAIPYLKI